MRSESSGARMAVFVYLFTVIATVAVAIAATK